MTYWYFNTSENWWLRSTLFCWLISKELNVVRPLQLTAKLIQTKEKRNVMTWPRLRAVPLESISLSKAKKRTRGKMAVCVGVGRRAIQAYLSIRGVFHSTLDYSPNLRLASHQR